MKMELAGFFDDSEPKPRPTCGTCPMWEPPTGGDATIDKEVGECHLQSTLIFRYRAFWCGQHPDMADWTTNEWPKVKR